MLAAIDIPAIPTAIRKSKGCRKILHREVLRAADLILGFQRAAGMPPRASFVVGNLTDRHADRGHQFRLGHPDLV
jgi:hypothetical protein